MSRRKLTPRRRVHLVCNAHLDPVWQWEWEEGAGAALSTFRTAAEMCEERDGFVFNHNEAILYMWVEEHDPELFERIRELVKRGKWRIIGGWFLQPDCNMPSGESLVRQILFGRTYFREKFGVEPRTAVNFDPFGHTRGLVQILAKSGYDSYLFCRPGKNDLALPSEQFTWVGFDGSEVAATRCAGYHSLVGQAQAKAQADITAGEEQPCTIVLWGVGNHGGGPSRRDLAELDEMIESHSEVEILHSTPDAYFADLRAHADGLPRHEADLNPWAVGCYTSQVRLKQKHRLLENELYSAEKMCASAALQGLMEYPAREINEALRDLLFCEFHDILPGSSVQAVEETSLRTLDHGLEILSRVKGRAFFALTSGQPKAADGDTPILVYNPHPFTVRTIVECELQLPDQNWTEAFTMTPVYRDGLRLPSQNEKEAGNVNIDWRKKVAFLAELTPSAMNRFDCRFEVLEKPPAVALKPDGGKLAFRTAELEVIINTRTGLVDRYCAHGVDYTAPGLFEPIVLRDSGDPWGMLVRSFRGVVGRFRLMSVNDGASFSGLERRDLPSVRVVEDGEVRTVVEAVFGFGPSAICQRYLLPKVGTEIEVRTRVYWTEKDKMLKLCVPVAWSGGRYVGQVAYGVQELPANGDEAAAQKWTAVVSPDSRHALTCVNDGVHGSDYSEDGLRLTLLRSPAYAAHPIPGRPLVRSDRFEPRIDQGERVFRFWLDGGRAEERLAGIDREALARNEKPMAVQVFPSGVGSTPETFVAIEGDAVQMTTAKMAEDGRALIIRLFEPTGTQRVVTLSLPFCGMRETVELGPFEIKTLLVDTGARSIAEVGLASGFPEGVAQPLR